MSANMSSDVRAEPNLTPLLDVVFQLITFFMLVINFSDQNYDQRVHLPVAGSAKPIEDGEKASEDRLVLNIDRQGHLLFNGETMPINKASTAIKREASYRTLAAKTAGIKLQADGSLPTTVILRADKDTPFSSLFALITACQANGFHKFALKAMSGP